MCLMMAMCATASARPLGAHAAWLLCCALCIALVSGTAYQRYPFMARAVDIISRPWRFPGVSAKSADQGRGFLVPCNLSENLTEVTAIHLAALSYITYKVA